MHSPQITALLALMLSLAQPGITSPTKDMRGLADASFVEIPSEIDTNSTFGWRDASDITSALEKRDYPKPDQCWKYPRGIGGSVSQYKSDLGKLRADMDSDIGSLTLPPMSAHKASRGIASVIVRNQDNCVTVSLKVSSIAYYIKGIEDFCDDHSGWVVRKGDRQLVIIAEPNAVAPPAYSPRCNYY